jgi:hypothetical protein
MFLALKSFIFPFNLIHPPEKGIIGYIGAADQLSEHYIHYSFFIFT